MGLSNNEQEGKAIRYDAGKTDLSLVPPEVVFALGDVLTYGDRKYSKEGGKRNWERGLDYSRVYASLQRHLQSFWQGEDTDAESGLPHIELALTNAAFLTTYQRRGTGKDDRPKSTGDTRK